MTTEKKLLAILAGVYALSLFAAIAILFKTPHEKRGGLVSVGKISKPSAASVAVVEIYGPIRMAYGVSRFASNPERVARKLRGLAGKNDVKAVVLRINSPGGTVAAVQEIYDEVANLRKNGKIVVASLGDVAASGGYYIAAGADKIVANPGTLTGSIGVIFELMQAQELLKKIGVKIETVKSGRYKDTGSLSRALSDEEKNLLQEIINDAYEQFVAAIVAGRNMPREKVLAFSDGRIFTGAQAKRLGMIDELGGRNDAIGLAAKLSGIEGAPNVFTERDPVEEFFQMFDMSQFSRLDALKSGFVSRAQESARFEYTFE